MPGLFALRWVLKPRSHGPMIVHGFCMFPSLCSSLCVEWSVVTRSAAMALIGTEALASMVDLLNVASNWSSRLDKISRGASPLEAGARTRHFKSQTKRRYYHDSVIGCLEIPSPSKCIYTGHLQPQTSTHKSEASISGAMQKDANQLLRNRKVSSHVTDASSIAT